MIDVGNVVHTDPAIMSGEPVFVGTRVPFKNLIDYLAAGDWLEKFLESFPPLPANKPRPLWSLPATP